MLLARIVRRIATEFSNALPIGRPQKTADGVIISLTSYPARLKRLHVVVRSLLKQRVAAQKVILYLGTDTKDSDVPQKLKRLLKYNFEIRMGCEDLKPHKKYFFAMQEFPDCTIITADDDLIYDRNLVKDLTECAQKNPGCVCARRVNLITKDKDGELNPYSKWKWECRDITSPSDSLIATGCGGVLYPPHVLPKEAFDKEAIKENCLNTDDIWLRFMELKAGAKVVWSNNKVVHPLTLRHTQESGLLKTNTAGQNRNDVNIKKMQEFTGIKLADFLKPLNKVVFVTGHSWESNRQGGFHKFAQAACQAGAEVVFFSFPRPYYAYFMRQELFNKKSVKALQKGIFYDVANSRLVNVTLSTLKLPNFAGKFLGDGIMNALERFSFTPFKRFAKKWLAGADAFVFESCDGMIFVDRLKKMFPQAKMIYRPSDPMMYDGALPRYVKNETHMMRAADLNVIVNQEGLDLYRRKLPDFDKKIKWQLLTNGVDIESYQKSYPVPPLLQKPNTILYVGAWEVEWPLLFKAAQETPDFNYIVVCPNYPSKEIQEKAAAQSNLFYVPGIKPADVPAWITNCRVVMVPYVTDFYKNRPLGITAKYYQAMAAKKPIVAYCDTPKLSDAGAVVTYAYGDFIGAVKEAAKLDSKEYSFDLSNRRWESVTQKFLQLVENC